MRRLSIGKEVDKMRKGMIVSLVLATCMLIGSAVYAHSPGGCGACLSRFDTAHLEKVKTFQKDTLQLRDELMTKKFELRYEYAKPSPDRQRIASLHKEVIDIRAQIHQKADESGIPLQGCGTIGKRMMGRKMMMMRGHPCPVKL